MTLSIMVQLSMTQAVNLLNRINHIIISMTMSVRKEKEEQKMCEVLSLFTFWSKIKFVCGLLQIEGQFWLLALE